MLIIEMSKLKRGVYWSEKVQRGDLVERGT
jgi:hypothetical protein